MPTDSPHPHQHSYLSGLKLHWATWRQTRPNWDHDHCALCQAKFMVTSDPDVLPAGYTDTDEYYWICPECYQACKDEFGWG